MERFGIIGENYKNVGNLQKLSKFSFNPYQKAELNFNLRNYVNGILYISTCNRHEVFYSLKTHGDHQVVSKMIASYFQRNGLPPGMFLQGNEAIRYFIELSMGLHSLIFGETDIYHQLKCAIQPIQENNLRKIYHNSERQLYSDGIKEFISNNIKLSSKQFKLVLRQLLEESRKLRRNIPLIPKPVAIVSLTSRKIKEFITRNNKKKIVIIGAGMLGKEFISIFRNYPCIWVIHTKQKIDEYNRFKRKNIEIITWDEFQNNENYHYNIGALVTVTNSKETLIDLSFGRQLINKRRSKLKDRLNLTNLYHNAQKSAKDIVFIDLSNNNNIETGINNLKDIELLTYENIARAVNNNQIDRNKLLNDVTPFITQALIRLNAKLINSEYVDIIKKMQENVYNSGRKKLDDLLDNKLNHLSNKDKKILYFWAIDFNKKINKIQMSGMEKIIHNYYTRNHS
jgi:glutamyl-tRNA reductase